MGSNFSYQPLGPFESFHEPQSAWKPKPEGSIIWKHTVDSKKHSPIIGPFRGIFFTFIQHMRLWNTRFWRFPEVLEGWGSSGRLVETISTDPGTSSAPWWRAMVKDYLFFWKTVCHMRGPLTGHWIVNFRKPFKPSNPYKDLYKPIKPYKKTSQKPI